jgi:DNA-binding transcriptional LysR family regulator
MSTDNKLPLYALEIFEQSARLGSFSAAAKQMALTQPAVSHAIKKLENWIGVALLIRNRSGVELTEAGKILYKAVSHSLDILTEAIGDIRQTEHEQQSVVLHLSTATATYWLMPRIAEFYRQNPEIEVHCITRDNDAALKQGRYDLAIPLGYEAAREATENGQFHLWQWIDELVYPVISPQLYAKFAAENPEKTIVELEYYLLQNMPLIHLEHREESRLNWADWCAAEQIELPKHKLIAGNWFNDYFVALSAVISGQGVGLGWHHIVKDMLDESRFKKLGNREYRTGKSFVIIAPKRKPLTAPARKLKQWLLENV